MFGIDDLLFVGFVAVVAKTLHWMMNQPRHDDDSDSVRWSSYYHPPSYRIRDSSFNTYNRELDDLTRSLNRIREQSNIIVPDFSAYNSSRRRRPRSYIFDRETGELWEE